MPSKPGTAKKEKCLKLIPPKISIIIKVNAKHIVIDIFGSNITKKQNKPPTNKTGSKVLNFFIFE